MLMQWWSEPHVAQWWGKAKADQAGWLGEPGICQWIGAYQGTPFAYLQDYAIADFPEHPVKGLPDGARALDLFVGPPEMLGQGHGPGILAARMAALVTDGVPCFGIDPSPDNQAAIAAYRKIGFRQAGPIVDSLDGPAVPMVAWAQDVPAP